MLDVAHVVYELVEEFVQARESLQGVCSCDALVERDDSRDDSGEVLYHSHGLCDVLDEECCSLESVRHPDDGADVHVKLLDPDE